MNIWAILTLVSTVIGLSSGGLMMWKPEWTFGKPMFFIGGAGIAVFGIIYMLTSGNG